MNHASSPPHRSRLLACCTAILLLTTGCATTRVYERERIADPAMTFDEDAALAYLRNKIEAAREGGFGGFGGSAAGGCGCE